MSQKIQQYLSEKCFFEIFLFVLFLLIEFSTIPSFCTDLVGSMNPQPINPAQEYLRCKNIRIAQDFADILIGGFVRLYVFAVVFSYINQLRAGGDTGAQNRLLAQAGGITALPVAEPVNQSASSASDNSTSNSTAANADKPNYSSV